MRRIISITLATVIFCAALLAIAYSVISSGILDPSAPQVEIQRPTLLAAHSKRDLDIEKLYSHIQIGKDYARTVEKAALAEFDATNSPADPGYEDARHAVQLYVCYLVGGDFYGEGILQNADAYAGSAWKQGCRDPLILTICDVYTYERLYSIKLSGTDGQFANLALLLDTNYPALAKFEATVIAIRNIARFMDNRDSWREDMTPAAEKLPQYLAESQKQLDALVTEGLPSAILPAKTGRLAWASNDSPETMASMKTILEEFCSSPEIPANVQALCLGNFFVDWAWTARGTGWADSVTEEGWALMRERLNTAASILGEAITAFPKDAGLPAAMISVELGQGLGKERMDRFFDDAVALDADNYSAYSRKMYYLQPRWHGSVGDVINFGKECVSTQRWSAKIPLVFMEGFYWIGETNPEIYNDNSLWKAVSAIYQEFLDRYPNSINVRTKYLRWAVSSKKWDVAIAQRDILQGNWDRHVLSKPKYKKCLDAIPENPRTEAARRQDPPHENSQIEK